MKTATIGTLAILAAATFSMTAWGAPAKPEAKKPVAKPVADEAKAGPKVDPAKIWQAGLDKIAGRYTFLQVASPGGFWQSSQAAGSSKVDIQQISLTQAPAALREKLLKAEIIISDLKMPHKVEAAERLSPSKRGMLRFYEEQAPGTLVIRNLPGISGDEDTPDYSGPVLFKLEHTSHSNPSVTGVLTARQQQEPTWGAATLDFASLGAVTVPKDENDEGISLITNARILRSGVEIFAFVEWVEKDDSGTRKITGSVRMVRQPDAPKAPAAGATQ